MKSRIINITLLVIFLASMFLTITIDTWTDLAIGYLFIPSYLASVFALLKRKGIIKYTEGENDDE